MQIDFGMLGLIFVINFAYITLNTLRFLLVMRGYRYFAAFMSVVEITIYVLGLSLVLNRLDNPINLIVYALGYGVGVYVGMMLEDKLDISIPINILLDVRTPEQLLVALQPHLESANGLV